MVAKVIYRNKIDVIYTPNIAIVNLSIEILQILRKQYSFSMLCPPQSIYLLCSFIKILLLFIGLINCKGC